MLLDACCLISKTSNAAGHLLDREVESRAAPRVALLAGTQSAIINGPSP